MFVAAQFIKRHLCARQNNLTTSIVECPHCHYRFNYEFIPSASFYSIRLGTNRIFKCPNCKELHNFKITHFGTDPSLPTHGDNAETGIGAKIWALMLGPLLALVVIGFLLLFTSISIYSRVHNSSCAWNSLDIVLYRLSLLES